jgi:hypothetical protein
MASVQSGRTWRLVPDPGNAQDFILSDGATDAAGNIVGFTIKTIS